jgi:hypothetical protein
MRINLQGFNVLLLQFKEEKLTFKSKPITFVKVKQGIVEITIINPELRIF